ncbi:hypothetical protein C0991_011145 [Blastosporella zonata]|nr:hypothetical protein C0991_011145 [Blastosporella zonata]
MVFYAALDMAAELDAENATLRCVIYLQREDMKFSSLDLSNFDDVLAHFKQMCLPFCNDTEKFKSIISLAGEMEGQPRDELHAVLRQVAEEIHRVLGSSMGYADQGDSEDQFLDVAEDALNCLNQASVRVKEALRSYHGVESDLAKFVKSINEDSCDLTPKGPSKYEVVG